MYQHLDEEFYVENPFLAHLRRLGWKVYMQNKDNPEDTKEITGFNPKFEPVYGESVTFRETFREVILEGQLREAIKRINPWIEETRLTRLSGG